MAPYDPPVMHYAHLKVDLYDDDMIKGFMGPRGSRFYNLTSRLKVRYIWWNRDLKVIEIWGPYESHRDFEPVQTIHDELEHYIEHHYFKKNVSEDYIGGLDALDLDTCKTINNNVPPNPPSSPGLQRVPRRCSV
jgi:hypothetical protein